MRSTGRRLLYTSSLLVSIDTFLTIEYGFARRAAQLLRIAAMAVGASAVRIGSVMRLPTSTRWLPIWAMGHLARVLNAGYVSRALGYGSSALLRTLIVIMALQVLNRREAAITAVRWFLEEDAVASAFGTVQFILPLPSLSSPLIRPWWIVGRLAGVQERSFASSYFGTYLLEGWGVLAHIAESHAWSILPRRMVFAALALVLIAIVVGSSRTAIASWLATSSYAPSPPSTEPAFDDRWRGRRWRSSSARVLSS